nr:ATP-dependent Clp protease proteolytic subunit [Brevibacterium daeguense]
MNAPTSDPHDFRTAARLDTLRELHSRRVVVFNGELDDDSGMEIISRLLLLSEENPADDIHLWINSPGGSVPMRYITAPVSTMCVRQAVADAALLLAAGSRGTRAMLPHARPCCGSRRSRAAEHRSRTSSSPRTKSSGSETKSSRSSLQAPVAAASSCGRILIGTWC